MTKHWLKISLVLAMGIIFSTTTAMAALFDTGDVFASTGSGTVRVYDPTAGGTLLTTLNTGVGGFTTGSVTNNANGNFYVTNFSNNSISGFNNNGGSLGLLGSCTGCAAVESILIDGSGNFYVGNAGTAHIIKFDGAGNLLTSYAVAPDGTGGTGAVDWIDLNSNQTTFDYAAEGHSIKRFDTVAGQLTDLISTLPGSNAFALRILGDGSVLVADSQTVERVSAGGAIIQTYAITGNNTGLFSLNLDPDGTSFWTGDFANGDLYKVDIASGTVLNTIATCGSGCLYGVSISGEVTQSSAPEPGQLGTSLALIGLLALFGYRRSKANKAAENA